MYRRPKFLEILIEIRQEMALEADYDVVLFAEIARSGNRPVAPAGSVRPLHEMSSSGETDEIPEAPRLRNPVIK